MYLVPDGRLYYREVEGSQDHTRPWSGQQMDRLNLVLDAWLADARDGGDSNRRALR